MCPQKIEKKVSKIDISFKLQSHANLDSPIRNSPNFKRYLCDQSPSEISKSNVQVYKNNIIFYYSVECLQNPYLNSQEMNA